MAEADDPQDGLERKLATILSADVAAYSRLMAEDEEHTLQIFRGHSAGVRKAGGAAPRPRVQHRRRRDPGRVRQRRRSGALRHRDPGGVAYPQRPVARRPPGRVPHRGQSRRCHGAGRDLLGDGVNVAARLQGAAEPGGICIAGSVYDQIRNKLSLAFTPLGDVSYKNIPQAVRTFAIAEAGGLGALPAPAPRRNRTGGVSRWPVIAAIVLLLLAASAAFWAYSEHQRRQAEFARQAVLAAQKTAAEQARQRAEAQRPLETHPNVETRQTRPAAAPSPPATPATPALVGSAPPALPQSPAGIAKPGATADPSGLYRGRICYGPGQSDPAHCYEAQAIVLHNRISGEWPGRVRGATIYLSGHISPAGQVDIHMHSKRADGSRFAVIDMIGTLRDGRIDAAGAFRNGRHTTLSWRKD